MTPAQNHEHHLTETLTRQADRFVEQGGSSVELDQVLARAGEIRRGRRMRASLLMAAVVIAVAVPIGITVLRDQPGDRNPGPTGPPTSSTMPTTTPTANPTAVPADAVARVPLGAAPQHSYVLSGVVHNVDGSTSQLPAAAAMDQITPYLGGYLAGNGQTNTVTLYDGTGKVVKSGSGPPIFVTSSGGIETAYVMGGKLYSNPGSGMASGDGAVGPVDPSTGRPIGYIQSGLLYVDGTKPSGAPRLAVTAGATIGHDLDPLTAANATYDIGNLVAGDTKDSGIVISLNTHKALWSSPTWSPVAFSQDGKYVAASAIRSTDGIAILSARTGRVLASYTLAGSGITMGSGPVFDNAGNLLFVGIQTKDRGQAILRLSPNGTLTRATDVVKVSAQTDAQSPFSLPAGPQ